MNLGDVAGEDTLSQTPSLVELPHDVATGGGGGGGGGGGSNVGEGSSSRRLSTESGTSISSGGEVRHHHHHNLGSPEAVQKFFTDKTVDALNELREKGQLCDGLVRCTASSGNNAGGETGESPAQLQESFLVHRNVLSASSAFFRAVFTSGARSGGRGAGWGTGEVPQEVAVGEVSGETLGLLIDYCYGRSVLLREDNVLDVFRAADRLMMPEVARECCRFLRKQLCPQNCLGITAFARAYFRSGLERYAMRYAFCHFSRLVSDSPEFLELSADALYEFLSSDELNVRNEDLVFEAICQWIQHDPENRKSEMTRMLRAVRLGFLSTEYLMERIKSHEYVRSNEDAKQIVIEALKYVSQLESKELTRFHCFSPMSKPRLPYEILFVIGGWSGGSPTNIIETYDTRADQWLMCRAPDCEPRAYHACVTVGHVIYIVGGFNGVDYFNSCRKFYPKAMQWVEAPPMNSKRCYVSAVSLHGKVYALGGFDGHVRLNTVERLDPASNQWSHVMPMTQQRSDAKATVLNDKIYICGGFNGQECLNTAEYFNLATNQWTMLSPMRNRRSGVGVAAYRGCIYALGGFNGITRMNSVERYDPESQVWTLVPEMYSQRSNFAVGVVDELLFAVGGFNGNTTISQVECYDDVNDEWFDASGLSLYRSALCACVVRGLPNIMDFVFKPKPPASKRKRTSSHRLPGDPGASSSFSSSSAGAASAPDGTHTVTTAVVQTLAAPLDVLNQLS